MESCDGGLARRHTLRPSTSDGHRGCIVWGASLGGNRLRSRRDAAWDGHDAAGGIRMFLRFQLRQLSNAAMIAMKTGEDSVENRIPSRAKERPTLYRAA